MSANKIEIPLRDFTVTGTSINIPLLLDFTPVDNSELIQTKFIDDKVEETINPIIDFKKVRFFPAAKGRNWPIMPKFRINLNFYTKSSMEAAQANPPTGVPSYANASSFDGAAAYGDIGFTFDDVFCRADRFAKSFLRLDFFDSPVSNTNNLLFFNDIYTQIGVDQKNEYGFLLPVDVCPISFLLGDSVLKPDTIHEGYYTYWFQDLVDNAPNKEYDLYMTATFNNASNGESIAMYTTKTLDYDNILLNDITGPTGSLYLKIKFKNDGGIYKYRWEPIYKQDATTGLGGVNSNPPSSISDTPEITFWQIAPNIGD